jgi:hypothetical protein
MYFKTTGTKPDCTQNKNAQAQEATTKKKKKTHKEKEFLSVREKCIEMRAITTSPGSERR